ncbi:hypothetical protein CA233_20855 [Sphingomonas sp. ABOLD]|uniref:Uncharacterized protein n=1 Tax=Sphingomonas trueperi TaxID=53317 RepID=A0A7X6BEA3_9SPHN|nr:MULTISPECIES: hypothetical protein [Sphingomonas]NJB99468.1 hypothetical protein [Sphingomonas trueperi]RSV39576.1 hypothetical protein CA233_20855 [Sphingomonas sp. ABOLD]
MSIDAIGALVAPAGGQGTSGVSRAFELLAPGGQGGGATTPQFDARFQAALEKMGGVQGTVAAGRIPPAMKGMFNALDQVNVQARAVSRYAEAAEASGGQLTPGEMVQLNMKCSEFMFQAQLTSNIANRSSDGVQQLFKQQ